MPSGIFSFFLTEIGLKGHPKKIECSRSISIFLGFSVDFILSLVQIHFLKGGQIILSENESTNHGAKKTCVNLHNLILDMHKSNNLDIAKYYNI